MGSGKLFQIPLKQITPSPSMGNLAPVHVEWKSLHPAPEAHLVSALSQLCLISLLASLHGFDMLWMTGALSTLRCPGKEASCRVGPWLWPL